MKKLFLLILLFCLICPASAGYKSNRQQKNQPEDSVIQLKNDSLSISIDLWGGAIVGLSIPGNNVNPLDWKIPQNQMPENNKNGAPFQGHFLCFGRWGAPTEGEIKAEIPHNGEPANRLWQKTEVGSHNLKMKVDALLENWKISRTVSLSGNQACFVVNESFANPENFARFTTVVQHATFGGDFLDKNTIVNSNAGKGFNQALISKSLTESEYNWPVGFLDSLKNKVDLQKSEKLESYVSTHVIDKEIGWATIASPDKNLLVGYVWKTQDYPWLHLWHGIQNKELWAKGIEFGTTGLGDTFIPEERIKKSFKGRQNYFFVDAHSKITKSYACFIMPIDSDFHKTKNISYVNGVIEVVIENNSGETKHLFHANF